MKNTIKIYNKKIIINTNSDVVEKNIVNNYTGYESSECTEKIDLTFNIIIDRELYNNNNIKHLCEIKYSDDNKYLIHKKCIVIINQKEKRVSIIIDIIDNSIIDDINRIIVNYIYMLLEQEGIFFVEASCVAIGNKAVMFIGDKEFRKKIIYNLLENGYNYVSVESVGIKYCDNNIEIINLPEKTRMRKTYGKKLIIKPTLEKILILKENISEKIEYKRVKKDEFERIINLQYYKHKEGYISYIKKTYQQHNIVNYNKIYNNIEIIKLLYNRNDFLEIYKLIEKVI
jgi:hypothetical protein